MEELSKLAQSLGKRNVGPLHSLTSKLESISAQQESNKHLDAVAQAISSDSMLSASAFDVRVALAEAWIELLRVTTPHLPNRLRQLPIGLLDIFLDVIDRSGKEESKVRIPDTMLPRLASNRIFTLFDLGLVALDRIYMTCFDAVKSSDDLVSILTDILLSLAKASVNDETTLLAHVNRLLSMCIGANRVRLITLKTNVSY